MKAGTDTRAFFQRRVTYFRAPGQGSVHVDQVSDGGVLAWSRLAMDALPANGKQSLATYRLSLRAVLKQGGIIVFTNSGADHLLVEPVKAGQYDPPRTILRLDASGGTKEVALPLGRIVYEIPFAEGDHLLIPVDDTAQRILVQFCHNLEYLSPDQSRTVLNVIARPIEVLRSLTAESTAPPVSIPLNMASSTAKLAASVPLSVASQITPVKPATANVDSKPAPIRAATRSVALTAAILPGVRDQKGSFGRLPKWADSTAGGVAGLLLAIGAYFAMALASGPALTLDTGGLLLMMRDSKRPEVRDLYGLQGLDRLSLSEVVKHPSFACALPKLMVLQAKMELPYPDSGSPQAVSKSLGKMTNSTISDGDRALVAYVSCQAFHDPRLRTNVGIRGEPDCKAPDAKKSQAILKAMLDLAKFAAGEPVESAIQTPFTSDIKEFVDALKNAPEPFRTLYSSHNLAKVVDPISDPFFARAVIKLELYRLMLIPTSGDDWNDAATLTQSVNALMKQGNTNTIKAGSNLLMAYLACQAWSKPEMANTGVGIPGVKTCPDVKATEPKIKAGLQELTRFVTVGK